MKKALAFFLLLALATASGSAQTELDSSLTLQKERMEKVLLDQAESLLTLLRGLENLGIWFQAAPEVREKLDSFQYDRLLRQKNVIIALKGDFDESTVRYRRHRVLGLFGPPVLKINGVRLRLSRDFVFNPEAKNLHLITAHVAGNTYDVSYYLCDGAGGFTEVK